MAIHDHYIVYERDNEIKSEHRMRFRRWKTRADGIDLDPKKQLIKVNSITG